MDERMRRIEAGGLADTGRIGLSRDEEYLAHTDVVDGSRGDRVVSAVRPIGGGDIIPVSNVAAKGAEQRVMAADRCVEDGGKRAVRENRGSLGGGHKGGIVLPQQKQQGP